MIRRERVSAELQGEFVVFLIGMRINQLWKIHKWLPVARSITRMLSELYRHPELGFLHAESWFARTILVVQYWRSVEQLIHYATDRNAKHLPAWRAFNRAVGVNGSVGIWHETYIVAPGAYENIYVNMPAFGLGRVGELSAATGARHSARERLGSHQR